MSGYRRSSYSSGSNTSWGQLIVGVILVIFLMVACKSCSRSEAHMVYIEDCYVYNEESHIIYIESETDRYGTNPLIQYSMMKMVRKTNIIRKLENGYQ